jgi:metal transporter CNNM
MEESLFTASLLPATFSLIQSIPCLNQSTEDGRDLLVNLLRTLHQDNYDQQEYFGRFGNTHTHHQRSLRVERGDRLFITDITMVFVCIICAGFASGLTQGLLSLDFTEMTIKLRSGTPNEKKNASKVLPIISRHHLLLVTLMLWNASATEALPIFLSGLVPEYLAVIISVTLVLFMGEIIPAAILTGPNQLPIAANLIPMVYVVGVIFFPVAYPISRLLDCILGHDEGITVYNRKEINTMIKMQHEEGGRGGRGIIDIEEMTIIDGAFKFRDMMVRDVMTPVASVFMLPASERLTYKTLSEIFKSGYSRIPVYGNDRTDIIGLVLTKDLIFLDPDDETLVSNFVRLFGRQPVIAWHDMKLGEALSHFRKGRSHLAIVRTVNDEGPGDPFYDILGIVTLEDIIEEILGTEIADETDYHDGDGDLERMNKRDIDLAKLHLLNTQMDEDQLTPEEVMSLFCFILFYTSIFDFILYFRFLLMSFWLVRLEYKFCNTPRRTLIFLSLHKY